MSAFNVFLDGLVVEQPPAGDDASA